MLHRKTIAAPTLGLLKNITAIPELSAFNLVGGTSLALQIGHRLSVDLDFFGDRPFETQEILDLLQPLGQVRLLSQSKNILVLNVEGVKVDFVNYRYPLINELIHIEGLRLADLPDISAMKLAAIAGRGRKKDFIDIYFLLKKYSLSQLFDFYTTKYEDGSVLMVSRSLAYFDDADHDEDLMLFKDVSWQKVKETIQKEVQKLYS
jgi:predicted nucleotidyltransferase component of viral defense system